MLRSRVREKLRDKKAVEDSFQYWNPYARANDQLQYTKTLSGDHNPSATRPLGKLGGLDNPISSETKTIHAPKDSASISKPPNPGELKTPSGSSSLGQLDYQTDMGAGQASVGKMGPGGLPKDRVHNETSFAKVEKTFKSGSNNNQNRKKTEGVFMDSLSASNRTTEILESLRQEGSAALEAGNSDKAASAAIRYNAIKEAGRLNDEIVDKMSKLDRIELLQAHGILPGATDKLSASSNILEDIDSLLKDKTAGVGLRTFKKYGDALSGKLVKSRREALNLLKTNVVIPGMENPYVRYNAMEKAYMKTAEALKLQKMARIATGMGVGAGVIGGASAYGAADALANYNGSGYYLDKIAYNGMPPLDEFGKKIVAPTVPFTKRFGTGMKNIRGSAGNFWKGMGGKGKFGLIAGGLGALGLAGYGGYQYLKNRNTPWYMKESGTAGIGALGGAALGSGIGRMIYGDQGALMGAGLGAVGGGHLGFKYNDQIKDFASDMMDKYSYYGQPVPYLDYQDKNAGIGSFAKAAIGKLRPMADDAVNFLKPKVVSFGNALSGKDLKSATNAYKLGLGLNFKGAGKLANTGNMFRNFSKPMSFTSAGYKSIGGLANNLYDERMRTYGARAVAGLAGVAGMQSLFGGNSDIDKLNAYKAYNPYVDKQAFLGLGRAKTGITNAGRLVKRKFIGGDLQRAKDLLQMEAADILRYTGRPVTQDNAMLLSKNLGKAMNFGRNPKVFDPVKLAITEYQKQLAQTLAARAGVGVAGVMGVNVLSDGVGSAMDYYDKYQSYRGYNPHMDKTAARLEEGDGWIDRIKRQLPGIALGGAALGAGVALRHPRIFGTGKVGRAAGALASKLNPGTSHGLFNAEMATRALGIGGATALGTGLVGMHNFDENTRLGSILNTATHNPLTAGLFAGALGSSMYKRSPRGRQVGMPILPKNSPGVHGPAMANLPLGMAGAGTAGLIYNEANRPNSYLMDFLGLNNNMVLPASMYEGSVNPYYAAAAGGALGAGAHMLGDYIADGGTPSLSHLGSGVAGALAGGLGAEAYNYLNLDYNKHTGNPRSAPFL